MSIYQGTNELDKRKEHLTKAIKGIDQKEVQEMDYGLEDRKEQEALREMVYSMNRM